MDADVEKLQNLLLDANLPSTIHDLRNPTEDFIINLIVTFLTLFKIDVNAITKPTFEQQVAMSRTENSDIIGIINLHTVMRQICDRIFIKDFCISDITNSGSKRVRRFVRYLANFILYATMKESHMEDIIEGVRNKSKMLEELKEKQRDILTQKHEKTMYISKQLALKEKYEMEIEKTLAFIKNASTENIELKEKTVVAEQKRQKVVEDFNARKLEVQTLNQTVAELRSEVVNSPEEFEARLRDMEEKNKAKIKEREEMQETFLAKDQLVRKYKNILSFVQKQHEKFSEILDTYERLKKTNVQRENIIEQVDTMKNNIDKFVEKCKMQENHHGSTIDEILAQTEERLTTLRESHAQLLSNRKLAAVKLENNKALYNDSYMEKNKILGHVKKIEEETSTFLNNCQDLYNAEVLNEINLRERFEKVLDETHSTAE